MPGDLMLSKLVIDILRISENMELVERLRCSPKLIMFDTDNFRRSLCDLSHAVALFVAWFPIDPLLFPFPLWLLWVMLLFVTNEGEGDVGLCSNGSDNEDLCLPFSSCSSIVAGKWLLLMLFIVNRVCLSSSPFECWLCCKSDCELGLIGGVPGESIEMGGSEEWGGGEGVVELIDCCVVSIVGESGGSEIQIDACCIVNLCSSWVDF